MAGRDALAVPGCSQELEKLLNSWGAQPTRTASYSDRHAHNTYHNNSSNSSSRSHSSDAYDAEKMIDELLASTWESTEVRRASLSALGSPSPSSTAATAAAVTAAMTAHAKTASFKQQTRSMNELQTVLAHSIEQLVKHRQVISERIASLEKENQKASSKFQDGLKNPEALLTVRHLAHTLPREQRQQRARSCSCSRQRVTNPLCALASTCLSVRRTYV